MKQWMKAIFVMEIKNMLSYRLEFWMKFLGQTALSFVIAYYLWQNIFLTKGVSSINGYSFKGMMIYSVVAPLIQKILDADNMGLFSRDIYEGGLTKYLIYPVDFITYKFIVFFAHSLFYLVQLIILLTFFTSLWGIPPEFNLSFYNFLFTFPFLFLASVLYFFLSACIEMVSFWADNTWSLMAMLMMIITLLGGAVIPLDFFPEWSMPILDFLPFKSMVYLPTQFMLGKYHHLAFITFIKLIFWIMGVAFLNSRLYRLGLKQYSGVGI